MELGAAASILLLLLLTCWTHAKLPLPSYVRPCSLRLSDRELSECAVQSARALIPYVTKGDPLYNIPVLDPLELDELVIIDGKGPLGLQLVTRNLKLYGFPKTFINSTTFQIKDRITTYVVTVPEVRIEMQYNVTGRILLLPIVGHGNGVITWKNLRVTYQYQWYLNKQDDGEIYYTPRPGGAIDADVDGMTITLDNLFNGDKALLETTNKFLNEEWREVFDSLRPKFAKVIKGLITNMLTGVFTKVPQRDAWLDVQEEDLKITDKDLPM